MLVAVHSVLLGIMKLVERMSYLANIFLVMEYHRNKLDSGVNNALHVRKWIVL